MECFSSSRRAKTLSNRLFPLWTVSYRCTKTHRPLLPLDPDAPTCDSAGCKTISIDRLCGRVIPSSPPPPLSPPPPSGSCADSSFWRLPYEGATCGTATLLMLLLQPPPLAPVVAKPFPLTCSAEAAAGITVGGDFPMAASAESGSITGGPFEGELPITGEDGGDIPCKNSRCCCCCCGGTGTGGVVEGCSSATAVFGVRGVMSPIGSTAVGGWSFAWPTCADRMYP